MKNRKKARKVALEILYQVEIAVVPPDEAIAIRRSQDHPLPDYSLYLVSGIFNRELEIDALIEKYAKNWAIERMPVVDRNILRISVFELLEKEVPVAVSINEAVELAKTFSTPDSGKFINGILSGIAQELGEDNDGFSEVSNLG